MGEIEINRITSAKLNKTLLINSKMYPDQNANDLTVYLNEEMHCVKSLCIIYVGIPCTFYNVSQKLRNNQFEVEILRRKNITLPDGFYDFRNFNKVFSAKAKDLGISQRSITFDVNDTNGKMSIGFRGTAHLYINNQNKDLLGFDIPKLGVLPRIITERISVGDRPANFKPYDYFHIHCDLLDTDYVLEGDKGSDILVRIPVKEGDFGEISTYYLAELRGRKCDNSFNKIRIWITDEDNNPIDSNGGDVQYELLFD